MLTLDPKAQKRAAKFRRKIADDDDHDVIAKFVAVTLEMTKRFPHRSPEEQIAYLINTFQEAQDALGVSLEDI
jgi:hypothetical protein